MKTAALRLTAALTTILLLTQVPVRGADPVAAARDLYAAASYQEALALLDALNGEDAPASDHDAVALYRTLCLFALGRTDEAQKVIESLVGSNPLYRLPAGEVPPRVSTAFSEARRRTLPAVLQQLYVEGKTAFDKKEFAAATVTFQKVLDGLDDPDIAPIASQPPLSDLRTLVTGFHTLSAAAAAPPPPPPAPVVAPPVPKKLVYGADDTDVVPPVVIRQELPTFSGRVFTPRAGMIEIVVDAMGGVESAIMRVPGEPAYDRLVLAAAKTWQYRPARLKGAPVKYVRRVQYTLSPTR